MWLSLGLAGSVAKEDQGGQWKPTLSEASLPEGDPHPGRGYSGLYMWWWASKTLCPYMKLNQEGHSLKSERNDMWQSAAMCIGQVDLKLVLIMFMRPRHSISSAEVILCLMTLGEGNCFHCDCTDITMKSGNMIRGVRSFSVYWTRLNWASSILCY